MSERVHIIPLGSSDISRATAPFEEGGGMLRPDRAVIVSFRQHVGGTEAGQNRGWLVEGVKEVGERLSTLGVRCRSEREPLDFSDFKTGLAGLSRLVKEEADAGNEVFINVSTAGRLTAIAAALAGMAHGATLYYARGEGRTREEVEEAPKEERKILPDLLQLKNFRFSLPDKERSIPVLVYLNRQMKASRADDLIECLRGKGEPLFKEEWEGKDKALARAIRQRHVVNLTRAVVMGLERDGYIKVNKGKRFNTYEITPQGKLIVAISGEP